ncbi:MAG: hypothetical protein HYY06_33455 [Deltaproteobacteria bacterium]|nr:hypothetical protein [Deltaproteobacteria bacterium]
MSDPSDVTALEGRLVEYCRELPPAVAQAAIRLVDSLSDPAGPDHALWTSGALDLILELVRALALSEAAHQRIASISPDALRRDLARPTLGTTVALCVRIGKELSASTSSFPPLVDFLRRSGRHRTTWSAIEALIARRNQWAHGPPVESSSPSTIQAETEDLFKGLRFLAGTRIVTLPDTTSDVDPLQTVVCADGEGRPQVAHEGRAGLIDSVGKRLLDLDPWIIVLGGEPGLEEADRICVLRRLLEDEVTFYNVRDDKFVGRLRSTADGKTNSPVRGAAAIAGAGAFAAPGVVGAALGALASAGVALAASPARRSADRVGVPQEHPSGETPIETPAESLGRGASPLLRFVDLLGHYMDEEGSAHLTRRLDALGFRGAEDSKLIEYCLERDLREILQEAFSEAKLHRIARDLDLDPGPLEPRGRLVQRVLEALRIPVPSIPTGLSATLRAVLQAAASIPTARDRAAVRGLIGEATTALERILSDLVRFYGSVLLGGGELDNRLRELGWLVPHQSLARSSMGTLFDLLRQIEVACTGGGTPEALRFSELFPDRPSIFGPAGPAQRETISRVRNAFSHPSEKLDSLDLAELRALGDEMFDCLLPFLAHMEEAGVYPKVIAVREMVSDAFGRRFVRAVDETGREEKIFTDRPMRPGALYFMHPLTNPVRIYPVLVEVPAA